MPHDRQGEKADSATVLVVDDDQATREALDDFLRTGGYRVLLASDGFQALELLAAEPPPSVVVLDILMPRMDGYTFLQRLRERPALKPTPVIAFTGTVDDPRLAGCVALLRKPVPLQLLLETIRYWSRDGAGA